jgi:ATP-dependent DNA helicase RecG
MKEKAKIIAENGEVESDSIEYKKSKEHGGGIIKTLCAYCNNYMKKRFGILFIGIEEVDDKKTGEKAVPKRPISGFEKNQLESVENAIKRYLACIRPKPELNKEVYLIPGKMDGKYYLAVFVLPGVNGPYHTIGKAEKEYNLKSGKYIRINRDTSIANEIQTMELIRSFSAMAFETSFNTTATLRDLDYDYMKEYFYQATKNEDILNSSKIEMARHLRILEKPDNDNSRVTNLGVLMFAPRPSNFIDGAYVHLIIEKDGDVNNMSDHTFDGPVWKQAKQAGDYIETNFVETIASFQGKKMNPTKISNFPPIAVRELINNSILHKEYKNRMPIRIHVYYHYISIINKNLPLPPVTITDLENEDFFDERNYYNSELMKLFKPLDLAETYGSGIRRAKGLLRANHSPELEYSPKDHSSEQTMVKIKANEEYLKIRYGKNERIGGVENSSNTKKEHTSLQTSPNFTDFFSEVIDKNIEVLDINGINNLSKIKIQNITKILAYIQKYKKITPEKTQELLKQSTSSTRNYLRLMVKLGFLRSEGNTNKRIYIRNY